MINEELTAYIEGDMYAETGGDVANGHIARQGAWVLSKHQVTMLVSKELDAGFSSGNLQFPSLP